MEFVVSTNLRSVLIPVTDGVTGLTGLVGVASSADQSH